MIEIKPIVLVTGVFDVITRAHVELLRFAGQHGIVIVGLNSDLAVRQLKGDSRPVNTYFDRAAVMSAFRVVQCVFEIQDINVAETITWIAPRFWIKGGDYSLDTLNPLELHAAHNAKTKVVLFPFVPGLSTTKTLNALAK